MTTFEMTETQKAFMESDAAELCLYGEIGSGKTHIGTLRALRAACDQIGSREIEVPNVGMITAPDSLSLRQVNIPTFLDLAGDLVAEYSRVGQKVTLKNGSEILFAAADRPAPYTALNLAWWYGDEAVQYRRDVFHQMRPRAQYVWFTTAKPQPHWLDQRFAGEHKRRGSRLMHVMTAENPFIHPEIARRIAELNDQTDA